MKVNTNNNIYIIIYSVVMVVIVAILLAVAALSLQSRQEANALNEKKAQIVKALGDEGTYEEAIAEAVVLDENGCVVEGEDAFKALQKVEDSFKANRFPLFKAKDGSVVVPVYGAGLWGPIWGYIALAEDMSSVKGVVFDHKGETPGLGAEIATEKHQAKYVGKQIYEGGDLVAITLVKGGVKAGNANEAHEVDAITGGTKTSNGVTEMLKVSLAHYAPYFANIRVAYTPMPIEAVAEEVVEENSNEQKVENNE